ncbi:DNA polymerase sliding clamp B1 [Acidilobus saccharovorans 345-15]|uniref:DNA polymerase sliding clamp n=1 Tax=Acidilobus saccharovorans (strain DSM 16705 / JCM 18335 / VKM B-2471 / 345-15) TaxID=666510 RepID=D9PZZ1_ACIS3|nr:DNA polymerase sliding clamp [Acidilobus saccharovorans]ADL18629.1 DNA polymerase sliding clamp B1 [Acidilobus saccharovorans 345-15]
MASLRAVYPEGNRLKRIVSAMAKVSDEATFDFAQNEVVFWLFSPDKTVLAVAKLEPSAFEEYSLDSEVKLSVNVSEMNRVVRRATRNDAVAMQYETGAPGLTVELQDRKTSFSRSFLITASESTEESLREINMSPTARVVMSADDLETLVTDAKSVGDVVELHASDGKLEVTASAEGKSYRWLMSQGAPLQELSAEAETKASYSAKSLYSSLRPIMSIAESVQLEFSTDYPLKVTINLSGPEQMIIYIAPVQG